MLCSFTKALVAAAVLAASVVKAGGVAELCSLPPTALVAAQSQEADSAFALAELKKHAIATWYTDRESQPACASKLHDLTSSCPESSRLTVVVYGLPNKDCEAGYSTGGFNQNADDYKAFVQKLADAVGQRPALFVLEPDAVGLLSKQGCGNQHSYAENVKAALAILSKNPNADIYLDVGYWTLNNPTDAAEVAAVVRDLATGGRVKGITLNTSNYRSNQEMSKLCSNFQSAYGDNQLHCIADTSRNYLPPTSNEWCNAAFGAIGQPPTSETGFSNLDYFIWIKPPGESDGTCDGTDLTADARKGPAAGQFFKEQFVQLWNNGYFVAEKGFPKIEKDKVPTPAPSVPSPSPVATTSPSPVATTSSPVVTTVTPVSDAGQQPSTATTPPPSSTSTSQTLESATVGPSPVPTTSAPTTQLPLSYGGETSAPAPAGTTTRKRCRSDLDTDNNESAPAGVVHAKSDDVTAAPASAPAYPSFSDKSVQFSADEQPESQASSTPLHFDTSFIAILVVGSVMGIAIAVVVVRRVSKVSRQKQMDRLRTPAQHFGVWQPTPSSVAII